ncbi:hypothetical protein [Alloactinosynnema sp. L-07]|uniref:hypothetical protein n=1 Tax=Alloactinosynnema sp. L-07 TaxID=1653480 RepID=UPI00065F078F|nr:hypothetical protein [Alloactinosynnema sp. L-07]CRK56140.1 hypothetical protein [Alloactinosynnema sp. L-07]
MAIRRALILGGTGMLTHCTSALIAEGWHVVVPSRRYAPLPAEGGVGRALWVEADWSDPEDVAARAGRALGGEADLLVAWVDGHSREPILRAVVPLLSPEAPVVEVHSAADPVRGTPDPVIDHPTQQVVLGTMTERGASRWLTQQEIAESVLDAVRRGLAGRAPGVHQIGVARVG